MATHSCSARECGEPVTGSETEESGLIDSNSHSAWQCHFSINSRLEIQSFLIIFYFFVWNLDCINLSVFKQWEEPCYPLMENVYSMVHFHLIWIIWKCLYVSKCLKKSGVRRPRKAFTACDFALRSLYPGFCSTAFIVVFQWFAFFCIFILPSCSLCSCMFMFSVICCCGPPRVTLSMPPHRLAETSNTGVILSALHSIGFIKLFMIRDDHYCVFRTQIFANELITTNTDPCDPLFVEVRFCAMSAESLVKGLCLSWDSQPSACFDA